MIGMLIAVAIVNVIPSVLLSIGFNLVTGNVLALQQVAGVWAVSTGIAVFVILMTAAISTIVQAKVDES